MEAPDAPHGQEPIPGRFSALEELARGGMGVVVSAIDRATGGRIAVKRLLPGASAQVQAHFEREYYLLSSLRHPCVVEAYEQGDDVLLVGIMAAPRSSAARGVGYALLHDVAVELHRAGDVGQLHLVG